MKFIFASLISSLIPFVSAHARLKDPMPLGYGTAIPADNSYNSPLKPDGSDFPCKGLIGKPNVSMHPTANWKAGEQAFFEIMPNGVPPPQEGNLAAHSGGSCQVSLSFDNGCTWKVIHSYVGGCPRGAALNSNLASPNQTFTFNIPAETRKGPAIFSWSWLARTGNRGEFYMNCAAVNIDGNGASTLSDLPDMFLGEMVVGPIKQGMCCSTAGTNFDYPNPGKEVTIAHEDNTTPVGPHNLDGTTDFSVCKAPCNKPQQPPPQSSYGGQPPAQSTPVGQPSATSYPPQQTTPVEQPSATSYPPQETTPVKQPPASSYPVGQPTPVTNESPQPTSSGPAASEFQDISLDGVIYECRPKQKYS